LPSVGEHTSGSADQQPRIMIVDDDEVLRENIAEILSETGCETHQATTGVEAVKMIATVSFDLIVTDIFMPDLDGIELIRKLHETDKATRVLAITGYSGDVDYLEVAEELGARRTLRKPFRSQELLDTVAQCLSEQPIPLRESWPGSDAI
jgi:CheY-like chemotaxis protein